MRVFNERVITDKDSVPQHFTLFARGRYCGTFGTASHNAYGLTGVKLSNCFPTNCETVFLQPEMTVFSGIQLHTMITVLYVNESEFVRLCCVNFQMLSKCSAKEKNNRRIETFSQCYACRCKTFEIVSNKSASGNKTC